MSRNTLDLSRSSACILLAFSVLFLTTGPVMAITNPAATYCQALGYQYQTVKADDGSESGYCQLQDGRSVDAWKFLLGLEAQDCSYCAKRGYRTEVVSDPEFCQNFMTDQCAACVLDNGEMVEITRLMNLSFGGDVCNDGVCGMLEDTGNCPEDCPSGERDEFCDAQRDGKCDPDCTAATDPDCPDKGGSAPGEVTNPTIMDSSGILPIMMEPAVDIIQSPGRLADLRAISLRAGKATFDQGGNVARIPVWFRIENAGPVPSEPFKASIDVIDGSGMRTAVPFTVLGQENIWYPTFPLGLASLAQTEIIGEVTVRESSGSDLQGKVFKLVARVDSCSGDEFMPDYCRVKESDESNNEQETKIAF